MQDLQGDDGCLYDDLQAEGSALQRRSLAIAEGRTIPPEEAGPVRATMDRVWAALLSMQARTKAAMAAGCVPPPKPPGGPRYDRCLLCLRPLDGEVAKRCSLTNLTEVVELVGTLATQHINSTIGLQAAISIARERRSAGQIRDLLAEGRERAIVEARSQAIDELIRKFRAALPDVQDGQPRRQRAGDPGDGGGEVPLARPRGRTASLRRPRRLLRMTSGRIDRGARAEKGSTGSILRRRSHPEPAKSTSWPENAWQPHAGGGGPFDTRDYGALHQKLRGTWPAGWPRKRRGTSRC